MKKYELKKRTYTYDIVWKDSSVTKLISSSASLKIALMQYGYGEDKFQDISQWRRTEHNNKEQSK